MGTHWCLQLFALCCFCAAQSAALALSPNEAAPASLKPGGVFSLSNLPTAQSPAYSVELIRDSQSIACEVVELTENPVGVSVRIPENTPLGLYDLRVSEGGTAQLSRRAVHVFHKESGHTIVACVANPSVGSTASADSLAQTVAALNASEADAVVVLGNLTQGGTEEEFTLLLETLSHCRLPTFLNPGPNDMLHGQYTKRFGNPTRHVRIGRDAFLFFDTSRPAATAPGGAQAAQLQMQRRACRDARWTLAFTHHLDALSNLRYPLILFVDDPVDALVQVGPPPHAETISETAMESSAPNDAAESPVGSDTANENIALPPWGQAKMLYITNTTDNPFFLLDIVEGGIFTRTPPSL